MDDSGLLARVAPFRDASAYAVSCGALNLSQGLPEPLFDSDMNAALARQVNPGWQYADPRGEMLLRESIAIQDGHGYNPDSELLVTSGCTEALYLALYAAARKFGTKVAFFEPFYPYYPGLATLLGLEFTALPLSPRGIPSPDWAMFEQHLRNGVRILLLNTPHNPTGWCMSGDDWQRLVALSHHHDFVVIVDEAYRHYQYDDNSPPYPRHTLQLMVAGSASKLLSMTGVRIGWLFGASRFIEDAHAHHLHLSYCQPPPLQAAIALLLNELSKEKLQHLRQHYKQKRDHLAGALSKADFLFFLPSGGHYIMADYSRLAPSLSPQAFSEYLAKTCGVMPLPATPFYIGNSLPLVRFSFSVSALTVDKACARLEEF